MPHRPHALIAAAAVFLLVLAAGEFWPSGGARTQPRPQPAAAPAPADALVDVVGAVKRPGVYRLGTGARIQDAIRAAGGARRRADLDQLDLAAPVADGQQIVVPRRNGSAVSAPPPATAAAVVHLNTADAAALDALPGVGPATAARIIAYRLRHGPFARVDELLDVPGIGPAKLDAMRGQLAL
jgi:competence protein ComEA